MLAREVEQAIRKARSSSEKAMQAYEIQLKDQQTSNLALSEQLISIYREIAKIWLLELPDSEQMPNIKSAFNQLKTKLAQMNETLEAGYRKRDELQQQHAVVVAEIEQQAEARDNLLTQDETFLAYKQQREEMGVTLRDANACHSAINEECQSKLKEYQRDRRYIYLLNRRFAEPEYKGRWIFRNLDSWLARQVNFTNNRRNHLMLINMLAESERQRQLIVEQFGQLTQQLSSYIELTEKNLNMTSLNIRLAAANGKLAQQQKEIDITRLNLYGLTYGEGNIFGEISAQLARTMAKLPIKQLNALVKGTPSKRDDSLCEQLASINKAIKQGESSALRMSQTYEQGRSRYDTLTSLHQHFCQSDYARGNYTYALSTEQLSRLYERLVARSITLSGFMNELKQVRNSTAAEQSYPTVKRPVTRSRR